VDLESPRRESLLKSLEKKPCHVLRAGIELIEGSQIVHVTMIIKTRYLLQECFELQKIEHQTELIEL
jgi:hypothetical protein